MRSTHIFGFLAVGALGFGVAGIGAGCGSDGGNTGGGGSGTTTSTTSTTSVATTTSTTSGTMTGCSTSQSAPDPIDPTATDPTACTFNDPASDANYFQFTGKKGTPYLIYTEAKTGADPFDPTYPDTVVTLLDASGKQIAQNDDPQPRSSNDATLWTILPADGDYIIKVQECNAAFGTTNCSAAGMITTLDYKVGVLEVSPMATSVTFGAEPNDDATKAVTIKYGKDSMTKKYYVSEVYGQYETATDVDVYSFTLPTDVTVDMTTERPVGYFEIRPSGTDGNGSTSKTGKVYVVDPADLTHHVAEIDASLGMTVPDLSPPLTLGKQYYLFVERPAGSTLGANDFYWFAHYTGGSNPIEKDDTANNTAATAEVLKDQKSSGVLASYFVDGDLTVAGTDVDFYSLSIPAGAKTVTTVCGAQRAGSGLRGFKISLVKSDGTTPLAAGATSTESASDDARLQKIALGTTTGTVLFKIEAASQDANVTSTFYRCAAYFE